MYVYGDIFKDAKTNLLPNNISDNKQTALYIM